MDLASYLLKPVQRMGKYALLLQQLVKAGTDLSDQIINGDKDEKDDSDEAKPIVEGEADLRAAEQMVRFQLRHGNDLLAMDSLRDCDVSFAQLLFIIFLYSIHYLIFIVYFILYISYFTHFIFLCFHFCFYTLCYFPFFCFYSYFFSFLVLIFCCFIFSFFCYFTFFFLLSVFLFFPIYFFIFVFFQISILKLKKNQSKVDEN